MKPEEMENITEDGFWVRQKGGDSREKIVTERVLYSITHQDLKTAYYKTDGRLWETRKLLEKANKTIARLAAVAAGLGVLCAGICFYCVFNF